MRAAPGPREGARLLVVDPTADAWADAGMEDLPAFLAPGDLLVLNDAATFPASLRGEAGGAPVELRLVAVPDLRTGEARAVLFGAGDWRTPTERRPAPPVVRAGEAIALSRGGADPLRAVVLAGAGPILDLRFDRTGPALLHALYACGRPVQYSYLAGDLPLAAVQTPFATRPWAMEMPSAGRALTPRVLASARRRHIGIATLTHAAGLSATGDDGLDARLPMPEAYDIPAATVARVRETRARGGRVVAVGTTVARALEGAARRTPGGLVPGRGVTDLILDAGVEARVIGGLISGMHTPGESHFRVLAAVAPDPLLRAAGAHAERAGYLAHEFGDATLVLAGALAEWGPSGTISRAA